MDFEFSPEQNAIREAVLRLCEGFDASYWLERDRLGGFPEDFHAAVARDGLRRVRPQRFGLSQQGLRKIEIASNLHGPFDVPRLGSGSFTSCEIHERCDEQRHCDAEANKPSSEL